MQKYLSSGHNKSCSNSVTIRENKFNASFKISLKECTEAYLMGEKEDKSVPRLLEATTFKAKLDYFHPVVPTDLCG